MRNGAAFLTGFFLKMLRLFDKRHLKICSKIFFDIYKNEPFNYIWLEYNSVFEYFDDIFNTPKFIGFVFEKNGIIIGACLGVVSDYFKVKKYRVFEFFIGIGYQGQGFGTNLLMEVQKYLSQKRVEVIEIATDRNRRAFDFYSKNNFTVLESNVNMIKALKP